MAPTSSKNSTPRTAKTTSTLHKRNHRTNNPATATATATATRAAKALRTRQMHTARATRRATITDLDLVQTTLQELSNLLNHDPSNHHLLTRQAILSILPFTSLQTFNTHPTNPPSAQEARDRRLAARTLHILLDDLQTLAEASAEVHDDSVGTPVAQSASTASSGSAVVAVAETHRPAWKRRVLNCAGGYLRAYGLRDVIGVVELVYNVRRVLAQNGSV